MTISSRSKFPPPDLHGKRWCYYVPADQDVKLYGGYVPSLIVADEPGHWPMSGDPKRFQAPWVWGTTLAEAQDACETANARLGLTRSDATRIVASSMRVSNRGRRVR